MQKRIDQGSWRFEKEYQCLFRSQSNTLFPKVILDPAIERGKEYSLISLAVDKDKSYYIGVDLARSGAASADFTVLIILPAIL